MRIEENESRTGSLTGGATHSTRKPFSPPFWLCVRRKLTTTPGICARARLPVEGDLASFELAENRQREQPTKFRPGWSRAWAKTPFFVFATAFPISFSSLLWGFSGFLWASLGFSGVSLEFLWVSLGFLWVIETTEKPQRNPRETTEKPRETPEKRNRRPPPGSLCGRGRGWCLALSFPD